MLKIKFKVLKKKRETPNDYTRFADAIKNLKESLYKSFFEPILNWLTKLLQKMPR